MGVCNDILCHARCEQSITRSNARHNSGAIWSVSIQHWTYSFILTFVRSGHVSSVGVPHSEYIKSSCSSSRVPGSMGLSCSSSARMHPTDHMSTAGPYCDAFDDERSLKQSLRQVPRGLHKQAKVRPSVDEKQPNR